MRNLIVRIDKLRSVLCTAALFFACVGTANAQNPSGKALTVEDYAKWGTIHTEKLSADGRWAIFTMKYAHADTLYLYSTDAKWKYSFTGVSQTSFVGDKVLLMRKDKLDVVQLSDRKSFTFNNVENYKILDDTSFVLESVSDSGSRNLILVDQRNKIVMLQDNVGDYSFDKSSGLLAMACRDEEGAFILIFNSKSGKTRKIAVGVKGICSAVSWQHGGKALAFIYDSDTVQLSYYDNRTGSIMSLDTRAATGFPAGMSLNKAVLSNLAVSPDGKRVFFTLSESCNAGETPAEVWNANDKKLYIRKEFGIKQHTAIWWPHTQKIVQVTNDTLTNMVLNGTMSHALLYDPFSSHPLPTVEGPSDIYLWDFEKGERKLFLKYQDVSPGMLESSPIGCHFIYYRENELWSYDASKEITIKLTDRIKGIDRITNNPYGIIEDGFRVCGWRDSGASVLVASRNSLFEIMLDGSSVSKLAGSKQGIRLIPYLESHNKIASYNAPNHMGVYRKEEPLLIETKDGSSQSLYRWQSATGLKMIKSSEMRLGQILASADAASVILTIEDFNVPPRLIAINKAKENILFQSNSHHFDYAWGHSELLSYRNAQGDYLQGALFYPAGYQNTQKYPLIVSVYQTQSGEVNNYINPSEYNYTGINTANLTGQGYFVFLPDISYRVGQPGESALNCVLSGIDAVLEKASVDPSKMALAGHSFGGFETAYILTRTNIFATAVVGSGIMDFHSSYLYVNPQMKLPNFFKYESGQFRMGNSLFEDKEGYYKHSAALHADKITTPLLTWAGREDMQVHHFQAMELYLALRALGKEHFMLLYAGEGHILRDAEKQRDLTGKIESWFAFYLKGLTRPDWMK